MRVKNSRLQGFGAGPYPKSMAEAKAMVEAMAAQEGVTDYYLVALHNGADLAANRLRRQEGVLNARTEAFVAGPAQGAPTSSVLWEWVQIGRAWLAFFRAVKAYGAPRLTNQTRRLQGFGDFGGIIPYTVPGLPNGALEMGLGALVGYLIGNQKGQGLVGALFGVAAGSVLGQMQPAIAGVTPTQLSGSGVLVPATPGASAPQAAPDKPDSGFDWKEATNIIGGVLTDKQLYATGKEIFGIVKQAWGSETKIPAEFLQSTANYPTWSADGSAAWNDGHISSAAGDWNVLDQSTIMNPPAVSDADWSAAPTEIADSGYAYAGYRRG